MRALTILLASLLALATGFPAAAQVVPLTNFRNLIIGGDFTTNLWQRGTSGFGDIANTVTYAADRWANFGGASSAINISQQSITGLTGFSKALRFQRKATNANTAKVCMAQEIETNSTIAQQGQQMVLSYYALADANFSAASSQLEALVVTGTGTDEGTTSLAAGSWTGTANTLDQLQTITTGWARYQVAFTMPATATEAAVEFCFTPTGTAGTTDAFDITGIQLEAVNPGNPAVAVTATPFERRPVPIENLMQWRYYWRLNEPANNAYTNENCMATSTTGGICVFITPTQMRAAPASTNSSAGTFNVTVAAGTNQAVTGWGGGGSNSLVGCELTFTVAANLVAGNTAQLRGGGGSGVVQCNAEL